MLGRESKVVITQSNRLTVIQRCIYRKELPNTNAVSTGPNKARKAPVAKKKAARIPAEFDDIKPSPQFEEIETVR